MAELAALGPVDGVRTDVSDEASVHALAEHVYRTHGRCTLLFLNAGVTSGGGGLPWQQEPNDWRWCFGVNVFGVGIGVAEFVPRMIAAGEPAQVVVTSVGDGGFAPVATASVYAASKAAVSCFTEALQLNLIKEGTAVRASVFYPSGGLMDTGLYTAARNRPEHLQRVGAGTGRASMTFEQLKERVAAATGSEPPVADIARARRVRGGRCAPPGLHHRPGPGRHRRPAPPSGRRHRSGPAASCASHGRLSRSRRSLCRRRRRRVQRLLPRRGSQTVNDLYFRTWSFRCGGSGRGL